MMVDADLERLATADERPCPHEGARDRADGFVGRHLVQRLRRRVTRSRRDAAPGRAPVAGASPGAPGPFELTDAARSRRRSSPRRMQWCISPPSHPTARLGRTPAAPGRSTPPAPPGWPRRWRGARPGWRSPVPRRLDRRGLRPRRPGGAARERRAPPGLALCREQSRGRGGGARGLAPDRLRAVIARPFTHTGPGQPPSFALPGFVARLRAAKASGPAVVPTGNLEPVRDVLDVRDVTAAYLALLERGTPGEAYNVARGDGRSLARDVPPAGGPGGRPRGAAARPGLARSARPAPPGGRLRPNSGGPPAGRRRSHWIRPSGTRGCRSALTSRPSS